MSTFASRGKRSFRRVVKRFAMDCTLTDPVATSDPDTGTVTSAPVTMEIKATMPVPESKYVNGQLVETSEPVIYFEADQEGLAVPPANGFYATIDGQTYQLKGVQSFVSNNVTYGYAATLGGTN